MVIEIIIGVLVGVSGYSFLISRIQEIKGKIEAFFLLMPIIGEVIWFSSYMQTNPPIAESTDALAGTIMFILLTGLTILLGTALGKWKSW